MAAFFRALVPLMALGVGTWFGLGRPDAQAAASVGEHWMARAISREPPPAPAVPPLDHPPSTVDPSTIPDPRPPWPRLNPDDRTERAWLLAEGPAHAPTDGRRLVTFTFDDGPSPETAPTLLRILSEHKIRATFFFIGRYLIGDGRRAEESRLWASRIAAAGHTIGNHTLDHRVLAGLSHAAALAQIDDSAAAIERATGQRPWLFRPPYGSMDDWLEGVARDRHLELLLWNTDVQDMKRSDPDEIERMLMDQLEYAQGGIVLLHDVHWASIKAFNRLLRKLEASKWDPSRPTQRGWDIVDLGEYLRATAASPQPYKTRDDLERARHEGALDRRRADL
jgi:peptidoglycan/xylan/chitin deacetylase (PgdA/CDA1 family)